MVGGGDGVGSDTVVSVVVGLSKDSNNQSGTAASSSLAVEGEAGGGDGEAGSEAGNSVVGGFARASDNQSGTSASSVSASEVGGVAC